MRRLAALLAIGIASPAPAHPVNEVVQAAYLELTPGAVRLEWDITPGPAVAAGLLRALDADGDHRISRTEADAFGRTLLRQTRLMLDGRLAVWRFDQIAAPPYDALATQAATIQLFAVATRPERAGGHILSFTNGYQPAPGPLTANLFFKDQGWRYRVDEQRRSDEGHAFAVRYVAVPTH